MNKNIINEATGSANSGRVKVPLVLAPQLWDVEQVKPFIKPVSDYVSAMNAYDSYDGEMERDSKQINKNEKNAKNKAKKAKMAFTQNDDDGNPINGYSPMETGEPGTPDYIKKIAMLSKKNYEKVLKEDLAVWFGTKKKPKGSKQPKGPWVNICRKEDGKHPPCGRPEAKSKGYPKCRAVHVASKMSDAQKRAACQQKRRAEKTSPKMGTGNKPTMTSYKPKNEGLEKLIRRIIKEIYQPERLYPVENIYFQLKGAPVEIKKIVRDLKTIPCVNQNGVRKMCAKIPEVLYVYLTGRY